MGCWNHTCALTNLPIFVGDPVYVFLLEETPSSTESLCYPNTFYSPYPFWFQGDYNDYGAVENCRGPMLNDIVENVKKRLVEFEVGENQYHDIEIKKDKFDIDKLFDADHEDRLFVYPRVKFQHMKQTTLRLRHVVISHDVMERILDKFKLHIWYPKKRTIGFEKAVEEMNNELDVILGDELNKDFSLFRLEMGAKETPFWRGIQSTFQFSGMSVLDLMNDKTPNTRHKDIIYQLAVSYWIGTLMATGRNQWIPPSGVGSQSDTTYAQEILARVTLESAKVIKHQWDELDEQQDSV